MSLAIGQLVNVPKTSLLLVVASVVGDGRVVDDDGAAAAQVEAAAECGAVRTRCVRGCRCGRGRPLRLGYRRPAASLTGGAAGTARPCDGLVGRDEVGGSGLLGALLCTQPGIDGQVAAGED